MTLFSILCIFTRLKQVLSISLNRKKHVDASQTVVEEAVVNSKKRQKNCKKHCRKNDVFEIQAVFLPKKTCPYIEHLLL